MVATTSSLEHNIVPILGLSLPGQVQPYVFIFIGNERHQEARKGLVIHTSSLVCQLIDTLSQV